MAKYARFTNRYTNIYVKRRLLQLEIDIFGIISAGIKQKPPLGKTKILNQVRDLITSITVQLNLSSSESNLLWQRATQKYDQISKKSWPKLHKAETEDEANAAIYSSYRAMILKNDLIKESNEVMYLYEQRSKQENIYGYDGIIARSREAQDRAYSPFFLCSSHPKPAKDHALWEGRMYFDHDWEQFIDDDQEKDHIRAYIRNHKLVSVQWAAGSPVFLTTRRNCKHFFKNIPLDEVLHASAKSLLKKHKMYMEDENPASRELLTYREYYNRLKIEEALNELIPNKKLSQDMKRDRKLIEKWSSKLKK